MAMITIFGLEKRGERTTFNFNDLAGIETAAAAAPEHLRRWTQAASLEFSDGLERRRLEGFEAKVVEQRRGRHRAPQVVCTRSAERVLPGSGALAALKPTRPV